MNTLKLIYLTIVQLGRQVLALPTTITEAARLRAQRIALNEFEVERLDRIRHPEKYRGK